MPVLGRNLGRADSAEGRFWRAIVEGVLRRPVLSLVLSAGLMLALAVPVLGLHIGASGVTTLPDDLPSKQGYLALQRKFPARARTRPRSSSRAEPRPSPPTSRARRRLAPTPGSGPADPDRAPNARLAADGAGPRRRGQRPRGRRRARPAQARAPAAFAGTGARVFVGGKTAENADYFDAVTNPTPYVLAFVLGLSFIVLTVAFRSLVVALVSILLNLLSVGAAYGLLTLVFLHG